MSTLKAINLQHPTASTANITLSNTGGIALNGSVSGGGMDLITPTSVAGTGVTFSGGNISLSAAPTISVNGCFTSNYQNYKLFLNVIGSVQSDLSYRLRSAGTDASGANYNRETADFYSTTVGVGNTINETSFTAVSRANTSYGATEITMYNPQMSFSTSILVIDTETVGNARLMIIAANHTLNTSYDGISIIPSSGNLTGVLRVYGLRNS